MKLTIKAGEKLFINGAVIRSDKKITLEIINDAIFLLENHVMQKEEANTPLKQLYFTGQILLMDPENANEIFPIFVNMLTQLLKTSTNRDILFGLKDCADLAQQGKVFEILKILRSLFAYENKIKN